jgi:hypothetical protein
VEWSGQPRHAGPAPSAAAALSKIVAQTTASSVQEQHPQRRRRGLFVETRPPPRPQPRRGDIKALVAGDAAPDGAGKSIWDAGGYKDAAPDGALGVLLAVGLQRCRPSRGLDRREWPSRPIDTAPMGLEGLVGCAGLQRLRSYGAVATAQTQKRERAGVPGNGRSARFSVGDFVFAPGHVARPPQPEGWTTNQLPSRRATGARCSTRDASNGDQDGGDPQPTLTQRRREDADRAGVPGNVRSARFSVEDLVFAPGHVARPPTA